MGMSISSSFWGFVETVKQKSEEIVNIYKEDLSEFSKTIVQDTTIVVQEKLADLQLGDASKKDRRSKSASSNQSQYQARIALLQKDSHTYTDAPNEHAFEEWASTFNIGAFTETITHLLTSNESVREFHTRLVPAQVSYRDFWCRYYYRMHKLDQEEQRRAALVKSTIESNEDDDFNWDDEDDSKAGEKAIESQINKKEEVDEAIKLNEKSDMGAGEKHIDLAEQTNKDDRSEEKSPENAVQEAAVTIANAEELTPVVGEGHKVEAESIKDVSSLPHSDAEMNNPTQDDIDREIEQKYLQIQSSPTERDKLSQSEEDEWGAWE